MPRRGCKRSAPAPPPAAGRRPSALALWSAPADAPGGRAAAPRRGNPAGWPAGPAPRTCRSAPDESPRSPWSPEGRDRGRVPLAAPPHAAARAPRRGRRRGLGRTARTFAPVAVASTPLELAPISNASRVPVEHCPPQCRLGSEGDHARTYCPPLVDAVAAARIAARRRSLGPGHHGGWPPLVGTD